ncbi:MAG TPA: LamG-like jellyroll fold domain-containing protein [Puia sp.]|nr:LamG-like jellyroll fold domain-containing protein [Puia sp.]
MKTSNVKISYLILATALLLPGIFSSCSKKHSSGPSGPPPPSNPGGYDSSNQIQSGSLVSFWTFNGNLTDSKGGLTGTNNGITFTTGMLSGTQAFQGSSNSYYTVSSPGAALPALKSFTVSVWINSPQIAKGGSEEAFFQIVDSTQWQSNLHLGIIPSTSSDTLTLGLKMQNWPGDTAISYQTYYLNAYLDTAVSKWTNVTVTYDGATSIVNVYENGVVIPVNGPYTTYPGFTGLELFMSDPQSPAGQPNANPAGAKPWGNLTFKYATGLVFGAWSVNTNPPLSDNGSETWAGNYLGAMERLRVYNTALNSSDVKSLYLLEQQGF